MNRDIKFRAWDGVEMVYQTNALSDIQRFFRVIREDAVVMQFTGLKDKNGKEIYEGDYVTCNEFTIINGVLIKSEGEIVYCDNVASFGVQVMDEEKEGSSCTWSIEHFHGGFEVIGNIYENPELLK